MNWKYAPIISEETKFILKSKKKKKPDVEFLIMNAYLILDEFYHSCLNKEKIAEIKINIISNR